VQERKEELLQSDHLQHLLMLDADLMDGNERGQYCLSFKAVECVRVRVIGSGDVLEERERSLDG
jgi:hypothetical protein